MQQRTTGSKGWAVFTVVAVVTLGSTIASAGLGRRAQHHFSDAQEQLRAECTKAHVPCRADQSARPVVPEYRVGEKELESARIAVRVGRPQDAVTSLVTVLDRADHIDRAHSLVASLVAAKLFDGVSERVDSEPTLLDDPRLVAAIRRSSFASARRPLEAERLHALAVLATVPAQVPVRTGGFAESTTTQAMTDVNLALHAMEEGAIKGDMKACEAAAERPQGLAKQVTVGPSVCKSAQRIASSGQRLQRLQIRAAARSPRPSTKTARVPVSL